MARDYDPFHPPWPQRQENLIYVSIPGFSGFGASRDELLLGYQRNPIGCWWQRIAFWKLGGNQLGRQSSSGTNVTGNWVEGDFPRFCAGSDATGTYTITASSSHTITGMFNRTAGNTIVSGPGRWDCCVSAGLAGFLVVESLTVNNVIADSGGSCDIETEVSSGANLYY